MELPHKTFYIWRVSNYPNLNGHGGLIVEGRWHSKGQAIVYCAETIDCALGEIEKHLDLPPILFPTEYVILKIRVPTSVKIVEITIDTLPKEWCEDYLLTQPIGDKWLKSVMSPIAKVPSALFPEFSNYLINPAHRMSDFIEIAETVSVKSCIANNTQ